MIKVGITGGIGSGKTMVCKLFEILGVPVFYADNEAKAVMHSDQNLRSELRAYFGDEVYFSDDSLNRKFLANLVFNNPAKLEKLNSIVHPAVFKAFNNWASQQTAHYVVKEAALLFESESYKLCNYSVLVKSPEHLKIKRIKKRDSVTEKEIYRRMGRQLSDADKELLSDFMIVNDEEQLLIPQVVNLHQHFLKLPLSN